MLARSIQLCVLPLLAVCLLNTTAHAQSAPPDTLFPGRGRWALSAATGIPFYAVAEVALGVSDRFTIGAIAGETPRVGGVGVRPRVALWNGADQRVTLIVPTLYYPRGDGPHIEPWLLTRPSLLLEQRTDSVALWHVGLGMIYAVALTDPPLSEQGPVDPSPGFDDGYWMSAQLGTWQPLSRRFAFFADVDLVYDVLGPSWMVVGGTRVVVSLGVSWLP
jgi:hypothetical protein